MSFQSTRGSARTVAFIHTVSGVVSEFEGLSKEHLPDWKPFAILDESLLRNTIECGSLSDLTKRRLATYVWSAADAGADAIVVTCSTSDRQSMPLWRSALCRCSVLMKVWPKPLSGMETA